MLNRDFVVKKLAASVRCCNKIAEAQVLLRLYVLDLEKAEEFCKLYGKAKGPGNTVKIDEHLFFRKLRPLIKRVLEKCERENGFM